MSDTTPFHLPAVSVHPKEKSFAYYFGTPVTPSDIRKAEAARSAVTTVLSTLPKGQEIPSDLIMDIVKDAHAKLIA